MTQIQNSRRYNQKDIIEGKIYIESGHIPDRYNTQEYRASFMKKWSNAEIKEEQIYLDNKRVIAEEDVDTILNAAYLDPRQQGGRDKMHHRLLQNYIGISRRKIMNFLKNCETHQLHEPLPRPSVNQASVLKNGFLHVQIDLIDMSTLSHLNNNDHWILTAIDKFTKFAYALPLKNKSGPVVLEGIQSILTSSPRLPRIIQADNGKEFLTRALKNWLTHHNIKLVQSSAYYPQSNSNVEPRQHAANRDDLAGC